MFSNILLSINSADDFLLGKVLPVRVNKNFTSENRFPHGGDRAVVGSRHSLLLLLVSSTTNKKIPNKADRGEKLIKAHGGWGNLTV